MSTAPAILIPTADPDRGMQNLGQSAGARVALRDEVLTKLRVRDDIKPATILNRTPFPLKIETAYWQYEVPARASDKPFGAYTTEETPCFYPFRGNQEMSDKSLQAKWACEPILPYQQALEFLRTYVGENDEDRNLKSGGVVIFEGTLAGVTRESMVRVPRYIYIKGKRYPKFGEFLLNDLLKQADEQMFGFYSTVLMNCSYLNMNTRSRSANGQ